MVKDWELTSGQTQTQVQGFMVWHLSPLSHVAAVTIYIQAYLRTNHVGHVSLCLSPKSSPPNIMAFQFYTIMRIVSAWCDGPWWQTTPCQTVTPNMIKPWLLKCAWCIPELFVLLLPREHAVIYFFQGLLEGLYLKKERKSIVYKNRDCLSHTAICQEGEGSLSGLRLTQIKCHSFFTACLKEVRCSSVCESVRACGTAHPSTRATRGDVSPRFSCLWKYGYSLFSLGFPEWFSMLSECR